MSDSILLQPVSLGRMQLRNRVVMAPMTRSRADESDQVGDLHVEYYRQRAGAGLIITEGTQPSANGKGYSNTPGIYNRAQVDAWRRVTDAVHKEGGTIACQIMHCGRVGSAFNKASGTEFVAPSAVACKDQIYVPAQGMVDMPVPRALETEEIASVVEEYRVATENAFAAGFDAVELHGTSGYLPAQFLSTGTNRRADQYGGSLENRLRFVLETLDAMASVDGAERVGLRICPGNRFNDLHDDNPRETFAALLDRLSGKGMAYLHVIRMASTEIDNIELARNHFNGPVIGNESFTQVEAEQAITESGLAAVSFGRLFVANPDLVDRFRCGAEFNRMDKRTLYSSGAGGYTDYPFLRQN